MKIYLHELSDSETELDFTQDEKWVADTVARADEPDRWGAALKPAHTQAPRPIQVHFSLRKVDEVVVVTGDIHTHVHLVCSRCAKPFDLSLVPHFTGLFCKDPEMAGVAYLAAEPPKKRHKGIEPAPFKQATKPAGQNHGFARHAHNTESDDAGNAGGGQDLDITYVSGDTIDLSDVLSEQLQLQIPFQPLCKPDCKGVCAQCGADWNTGRCACAKLLSSHPFAALQSLKSNLSSSTQGMNKNSSQSNLNTMTNNKITPKKG